MSKKLEKKYYEQKLIESGGMNAGIDERRDVARINDFTARSHQQMEGKICTKRRMGKLA